MKRNFIAYLLLNVGMVFGMVPCEIEQKIETLNLRDIQVSYMAKAPYCVAVIGVENNEKKAFVALRYLIDDVHTQWTNFTAIPFNQENDTFALVCQGDKILTIQSSSAHNGENAIGYQIFFDPVNERITMQRVETARFFTGLADIILLF